MRKLLFAAVLSLAGVGLTTGQAPAWCFSCKKCTSGCATLCIKPYNAFSPICFGTIACDGCFPVAGWSCGAPPWMWGLGCGPAPGCCIPGHCAWPGCAMDGSLIGAPYAGAPATLPPTAGAPTTQPPAAAAGQPVFQPQAPMPSGTNTTSQMWMPPVQATGYRGMYFPGYPVAHPTMPSNPYQGYWGVPAGR